MINRAGQDICVVVAGPRAVDKAFLADVLVCTEARASQNISIREQVVEQGWEEPWWDLCMGASREDPG